MIFALNAKVMFIQNQGVCFLGAGPPRKLILKILKEYFVVFPVELQGC